jgi:alpha-1,2-mannosyltransferase
MSPTTTTTITTTEQPTQSPTMRLLTLISLFVMLLILLLISPRILYQLIQKYRQGKHHNNKKKTLLIMHPFCDAGGGGERVLFCSLKGLVENLPESSWRIIVITGDQSSAFDILSRARDRFGPGSSISNEQFHRIEFLRIKTRYLVLAETWPRLTLLGQSLGSMIMGMEALFRVDTIPHVYFDSMGYAFTYPIVKYFVGCPIIAYVHYPIISTDMLQRVIERRPTYNNNERVSSSQALTRIKSAYYIFFSKCYSFVGLFGDVIMTNSTWTFNHIASLWGKQNKTKINIVYPPCLSEHEQQLQEEKILRNNNSNNKDDDDDVREPFALSIGQFRPEKDHRLQLSIIKTLVLDRGVKNFKLVMIGSVRGKEDQDRIEELREYASKKLGLIEGQHFIFETSIPKTRVEELMNKALIGFHTMWNEHFGIGIVEMMVNGVITIAHNSGGPKLDIIRKSYPDLNYVGFLAHNEETYADAVETVLRMSVQEINQLRKRAVLDTRRFSEEKFWNGFWNTCKDLFL